MKYVTVVLSIILILFLAGCASCLTDSLSSMPHKHKAMWCNSYDKDMRCCVWKVMQSHYELWCTSENRYDRCFSWTKRGVMPHIHFPGEAQ